MCQCGVPKAVKVVSWGGVKHFRHNDEKSLNLLKNRCFPTFLGKFLSDPYRSDLEEAF